jgi:ubiquitin C-terminal hydrolase
MLLLQQRYILKAFIARVGSHVANGHFVTYARLGDGWKCFDDKLVRTFHCRYMATSRVR